MPTERLFYFLGCCHLDPYRAIHAVKTLIALSVGIFVMRYLLSNSPHHQWILITIFVVMTTQTTIGSTLFRSWLRLLGTTIGVILAVLTLLIYHQHLWILNTVFLSLSLILVYIASKNSRISYAPTLALITIAIILTPLDPSIHNGLLRAADIFIGIVITVIVSFFVLPVTASMQLKQSLSQNLKNMAAYLQILKLEETEQSGKLQKLEESLIQAFSKQNSLISDIRYESKAGRQKIQVHQSMLNQEREIFRLFFFLKVRPVIYDRKGVLAKEAPILEAFSQLLQELSSYILDRKNEHRQSLLIRETKKVAAIINAESLSDPERKKIYQYLLELVKALHIKLTTL